MAHSKITEIFVIVLLAAILLPISFTLIFNANTTGWDANTKTIFGYIPIIAIVSVLIILIVTYISNRSRG